MALRLGVQACLSAPTAWFAWQQVDLGDMPLVIQIPAQGFEVAEQRTVARAGWAELVELGLADRGRVHQDLADCFELLAAPRRSVDARIGLEKRSVRALAAGRGDDGVLAVLADGQLTVRVIDGRRLAAEIIALLPEHPAARQPAVSLPREIIDPAAARADASPQAFASFLMEQGVPKEEARGLRAMIEGVHHRGQFGAAVMDRDGRRRPSNRVVQFTDAPAGRAMTHDMVGQDGRVWTTVRPATTAALVDGVQILLDQLG